MAAPVVSGLGLLKSRVITGLGFALSGASPVSGGGGGGGGGSSLTNIRIGSTTPTSIYVGSTQVTEVYVGSTKVWG